MLQGNDDVVAFNHRLYYYDKEALLNFSLKHVGELCIITLIEEESYSTTKHPS
jgi:hypothetical protein